MKTILKPTNYRHMNVVVLCICFILNQNLNAQLNHPEVVNEKSNKITKTTQPEVKLSDKLENWKTDSFFWRTRITGNWWGARDIFEQYGFEVGFDYTGEIFSNRIGGLEQKTDYLQNFNLTFNFDLKQMLDWDGASINVYFLGNNGGVPGDASGAAQGISNIAANNTWKLYEFWIQQNLFEDKLSLLAGLYDLNSEFDTRLSSALFINPSHGIGPDYSQSGLNGPSIFSTTSLGFRALYHLSENVYIQGAVFDGVSGDPENPYGTHISLSKEDGALIAGEFGIITNSDNLGKGYSKLAFGAWYYTSEFESVFQPGELGRPDIIEGNYGLYAFVEKFLHAESGDQEQGLAGFLRVGIADENVNQFGFYFGSGLTYKGLIKGMDNDLIGIALALAKNGSQFIKNAETVGELVDEFEINIELTYSINILPWLLIQPDFQYVINPGTISNIDNALVLGSRIAIVF